jgi:hypothetical protein
VKIKVTASPSLTSWGSFFLKEHSEAPLWSLLGSQKSPWLSSGDPAVTYGDSMEKSFHIHDSS